MQMKMSQVRLLQMRRVRKVKLSGQVLLLVQQTGIISCLASLRFLMMLNLFMLTLLGSWKRILMTIFRRG